MIPKPMRSFMSDVLDNTNSGMIVWHEAADDAYFTTIKDANLHIRRFFDSDTGESGFTFRMIRKDKEVTFVVFDHEEEQNFMSDLYSSAGLSSAGGEAFFDDLFE